MRTEELNRKLAEGVPRETAGANQARQGGVAAEGPRTSAETGLRPRDATHRLKNRTIRKDAGTLFAGVGVPALIAEDARQADRRRHSAHGFLSGRASHWRAYSKVLPQVAAKAPREGG